MINKELLKGISDFDETTSKLDYQELVDNLTLLEKAHAKIHSLLITTRTKKLTSEFGQRESDIYVVGYPRSGSTLMQMMLYQMTTDGNMEFGHIYEVSPWSRFSAFFNRPMPSVGERRIIKSHDAYDVFDSVKKGKFIFLIRDCLDVIQSVYQQTLDYIDPSSPFDQLSDRNMKRWFDYNTTWTENKNGLEVLYVNYEDIVDKKEKIVSIISKFINIEIDESTMDRVLERTSFEFMKKHESKFGEQPDHWKVYNNFIRNGRIGEGKLKFTDEQLKVYHQLSLKYNVQGTILQRYFE